MPTVIVLNTDIYKYAERPGVVLLTRRREFYSACKKCLSNVFCGSGGAVKKECDNVNGGRGISDWATNSSPHQHTSATNIYASALSIIH